jgi:hypothetical protein
VRFKHHAEASRRLPALRLCHGFVASLLNRAANVRVKSVEWDGRNRRDWDLRTKTQ